MRYKIFASLFGVVALLALGSCMMPSDKEVLGKMSPAEKAAFEVTKADLTKAQQGDIIFFKDGRVRVVCRAGYKEDANSLGQLPSYSDEQLSNCTGSVRPVVGSAWFINEVQEVIPLEDSRAGDLLVAFVHQMFPWRESQKTKLAQSAK